MTARTKAGMAPAATATAVLAGVASRQAYQMQVLLQDKAPHKGDLYANQAVAHLLAGINIEAANLHIQHTARWFEHPHPMGRDHRGEVDFAALNLAFGYRLLEQNDALTAASRDAIRAFFLTTDFKSMHPSENHLLVFHVSRYLMSAVWPKETFATWQRNGRDLEKEDAAWLKQFIRYRAAYGWAEFDSSNYIMPDMEALLALYDLTADPELHRLTGMILNLLLADMAVDSLGAFHGGAQGRIYPPQATNHASSASYLLHHLYFNNGVAPDTVNRAYLTIQVLATHFRPDPLVVELARERAATYRNRERKHLHNMADVLPLKPLIGSIRKLTTWTADFLLGAVQQQDPYPPGDAMPDWARSYEFHQQHDWDLSFATNPRARLFSHHPGTFDQHNHWTGDQRCGCGKFFQHGSALLALHLIPEKEPLRFIHAYVPRDAFDELIEDTASGWIFVRAGQGYGALKLLNGYTWVTEGPWAHCEIQTPVGTGREAVICEAGHAGDAGQPEEYADFAAFRATILGNKVSFDPATMSLTYASARHGTLALSSGGVRTVNGHAADLEYPTWDSPYLRSEWGSGVVTLSMNEKVQIYDFVAATVRDGV